MPPHSAPADGAREPSRADGGGALRAEGAVEARREGGVHVLVEAHRADGQRVGQLRDLRPHVRHDALAVVVLIACTLAHRQR